MALGLLAYDLAGPAAGAVLGTAYAIKMVAYVGLSPVAAALARGEYGAMVRVRDKEVSKCGDDLAQVIYVDYFGNAMTGIRAGQLESRHAVVVAGAALPRARTYAETARGQAFWYENAIGLVEIAVNQGSAARQLNLAVGSNVELVLSGEDQA